MSNRCVNPLVGDRRWVNMHERFLQQAKSPEAEVVFIGDSIIEQLQLSTLWKEKIGPLKCLNFGIGGDRVEHVLWRIQNGELNFSGTIKAVVLFVGTNNWDCTPQEIFEGLVNLIQIIKERLGDIPLILPTLLPKGEHPNAWRKKNYEVNRLLLEKFKNPTASDDLTKNVHMVRIDENVVQKDQTISRHDMYDYLHLTDAGYTKIWNPVYDKLCSLLEK